MAWSCMDCVRLTIRNGRIRVPKFAIPSTSLKRPPRVIRTHGQQLIRGSIQRRTRLLTITNGQPKGHFCRASYEDREKGEILNAAFP